MDIETGAGKLNAGAIRIMNYLLYGPDTYRSRRKLREIIDTYHEKAGTAFNLHRFDAEEDDLAHLQAVVGGQSLFASKKLIVIERPFVSARQFGFVRDMLKNLGKSSETLVVLWEGVVGGDAKKMFAAVEPFIQKIQVFGTLQGEKLMRWLRQEISTRGFDFSPAEISRLAATAGDDLWALHNEIEKMAVASTRPVPRDPYLETRDTRYGKDVTVFQLGDTFFSNARTALGYLLSLLAQGEDEMRVFAYLTGHARTLLLAKSYLDERRPVSPAHKIHPFVVKKASRQVGTLSQSQLVRRLSVFLDEDAKIKTGLVRPEESLVRMIISRLILRGVSSSAI